MIYIATVHRNSNLNLLKIWWVKGCVYSPQELFLGNILDFIPPIKDSLALHRKKLGLP